ncbi:MAG: hypothetical protein MJ222_04135 [Bacilli bacterium]|nr:hypothetical protein [Bacilli bacterium]
MKKVLPLLVLASACLASCGDASVYGKYQFLLGRQGSNETRVSIEMELKDEASTVKEGYKNFNACLEMSGLVNSSLDGEDSETLLALASEALSNSELFNIDLSGKSQIPGYYKVLDLADAKYGNKVKIAFDLGEEFNTIMDLLELDATDIISHFIVSYCNGSSFTLQLPVSLDDIQMQLAWYGFYIDYDPYLKDKVNTISDLVELYFEGKVGGDSLKYYQLDELLDKKLPGEQNSEVRYGSHPRLEVDEDGKITVNEIGEMNEKYQGVFSNTFVYENIDGVKGKKIGTIYKEITELNSYYFFPLDGYVPSTTSEISCIIKEDQGLLDYDFSLEKELCLSLTEFDDIGPNGEKVPYYMVDQKTHIAGEEPTDWDWKRFYQKPFEFRDYHDIKIELKKE